MDTRLVLFLATLLGFCTCKSQDILLDEVTADVVSDFVTSVEFGSARSVCRPVPSAMTLCRGLGYGHMRLPTLLGHESAREAQQQSGAWLPLVHKRCHRDITRFLCSLFAPRAYRSSTIPCARAGDYARTHFPGLNSTLCVPGSDATSRDVIDVLQGNVLCDACRPESDAEHEIEENFCRSQFAFRLQIGSSSLEGLDLRVEPQGQSRVLRWEGGEQEQQVAMQQSALWLRDAGNCSCQALDGRSFGPLLALGDLKDGRIVLSRLVKWPHRERELKKFIRKLSKKPC
ncbi:hypothetical protein HF521_002646 [Silurus meridionalis]|uniref:Uncharacterized protein n=1 Tax=Silurus meridionalis TaxID=175797 RepID=A0A8T0B1P4_SILME|nr:hypothetical protein HF521_002646 [Silurus meridionalis]